MKVKACKNLIKEKINVLVILIFLLLFLTIAIPTFCRLLTEDNSNEIDYWDGTVATSYNRGDGTEDNPYIISTPEEFAYLSNEVNNGKAYDGTYFKLVNNIYLNNGVIEYKNDMIVYTRDSVIYYIKPFTNEYYEDKEYTKQIGTINIFPEMKLFRGNIDGNDHFIYGLYITDNEDATVSLFEELNNGKINNLYFSNTLIYGKKSASLINNTQNGTYNNLIFNGYIYSDGLDVVKTYNLDDVEIDQNSKIINLTIDPIPESSYINKISLKGILYGDGVIIDNNIVTESEFEIIYDEVPNKITIEAEEIGSILSDLIFEISYNTDSISGIIHNFDNSRMNNILIRGHIESKYIAAPLIVSATNNVEINNGFNDANVKAKYIASGLIGKMENASINMGNVYNSGNVSSDIYAGGIFGVIYSSYNINLHDSFNTGDVVGDISGAIAGTSAINIINHNNYYTNEDINSVGGTQNESGSYIARSSLLDEEFLSTTLKFNSSTWNVIDNELPMLITFDHEVPLITIKMLEETWNSINMDEIELGEQARIDVEYEDLQSDILKVEYYVGNKIYTLEEIKDLEFDLYEENIMLKENGKYYIIFKVTDVVGNVNIATTDLIKLTGYNLVISDVYNNNLGKYNNQISSDSTIKYSFSSSYEMENFEYPEDIELYLKTNNKLPNSTDIKLIDNINNKIYHYIVNDSDIIEYDNQYLYDLSMFKQIGLINSIYYDNKEINYYNDNILKENLSFIFDFNNTDISSNRVIEIDLVTLYENEIYNSTYLNLNKEFTLVKYDDNNKEINYSFDLETEYTGYLNLSQIGEYNIILNNNVFASKLNNVDIYNSNVDFNNQYLVFKVIDSNDEIVKGNLVNALDIEYNDKKYYADDMGIIKVPFINNQIDLMLNINYIITDINNGVYYLNISSCYDEFNCSENEIIPIKILNDNTNIDCDFIVNMDDKDRLILRNNSQTLNNNDRINLNIIYDGILAQPNVRVRLYKKLNFDSNNQVYELVDLSYYIKNNLENSNEYDYYLVKSLENDYTTSLELLVNNFQYGGYKFEFELYDGESFIQRDVKNIIVK